MISLQDYITEQSKSKYAIKKTEVSDTRGRIKSAYNVVDTKDGYIYDTFDLRRDAKAWIERAEKSK